MVEAFEIISCAPVFAGLAEGCRKKIAAMSRKRVLTEGELLFNKGEKADGLYVIGEGEIELFIANSSGKEQILHVLGGGELCAEVPLFQGRSYPASARAYTDVELCYVEGGGFLDFACENPEILLEMLAVISMRTKKFLGMVESLSLKDVTQRFASYLLKNADAEGIVRLRRSKLELAAELGTIPETLSRSIKKLVDLEVIKVCSKDKRSYSVDTERIQDIIV